MNSSQTDRFVHERLPSPEAMPRMLLDGPGLQFPAKVNLVQELLDRAEHKGWGERPLLRSSTR